MECPSGREHSSLSSITTGITMHSTVSSPVSPRRVTVALTSCFPTILRNERNTNTKNNTTNRE